tara:strand:+ start:4260 stop:4538 length:279 start_codon:yes stop_codon:yes gene_type:complete
MNETQIRKIAYEIGLPKKMENNWELLAKFAEIYIEQEYVQRGWITSGSVHSFLRRQDLKTTPLHKNQTKTARHPAFFKKSDFKKVFPNEEFE